MNPEQVKKQLQNMAAFIMKEAREKVTEINDRAEEEFSIEKSRLVQAEKQKIKADYEKKRKQLEVRNKIVYSNKLNQARLRKLKAREDITLALKDETKERLVVLSKPGPEYQALLKNLIIQGLLKLTEPKVVVRHRKEDTNLVQAVVEEAAQEYARRTGKQVDLSLDTKAFLPPAPVHGSHAVSCSGGVLLSAQDDRIICDNTLDQRLNLAFDAKIPDIRFKLFAD